MNRLPIESVVSEVLSALQQGDVLLQAEPGAGKSTGLPLALLDASVVAGRILLLEPRRLAARGVAERLAAQRGESVGESIGLRMRDETHVSPATRLEVVTEGVLTRLLQADPMLEGISLVVFDEFHERSLQADLALALCRDVQQALREDLRLLLMSATLDTAALAEQLPHTRVIDCASRQHPVSTHWLGESRDALPQRIVAATLTALGEQPGDILVFLPGVAEIERVSQLLQPRLDAGCVLHALHGGADDRVQRAATAPADPLHRRVILSTSIAETSITIDGVRTVIDSGLERRARLDASTGALRLETVPSSQASATQRAGRAGRTAPGCCYRLWSEPGHARRAASWQAEILRTDLAPLLMDVAAWGALSVAALAWLDSPPASAVAQGNALLERLHLLTDGRLSERGRAASELPVHPRLAAMLLWSCEHGVEDRACQLAAMLEDTARMRDGVDVEAALSRGGKRLAVRARRLGSRLAGLPGIQRAESAADAASAQPSIGIMLAQAFPDWIARRRAGDDARYRLACGAGAVLDASDSLARSPWLVAARLGGSGGEARIFAAAALDIDALARHSPAMFERVDFLDWDERQARVIAEQRVMLGQLIVSARPLERIDDDQRAAALIAGIRKTGLDCLPWTDECREWQARVRRIAALPSHLAGADWPDVDDQSLLDTLETWLFPSLTGIGSLTALARVPLLPALQRLLDFPRQRLLDTLLPVRYTVPSGSSIRLRYAVAGNPVLSVRLQEMFGCREDPAVANGTLPLTVELLSPAQRPVQVTEDLPNFWSNSYPAVRREMAGRYPKHHWPDDPLSATPTARAKPRRR